jgi:acyl phosphate:glycerol-3-phosphate acyltransferase
VTFDSMAYDQPLLWTAIVAAASYLLGSIPFGVLLTRAAGMGDVRNIGSGNIGATNVLRTGRKDLALATLLLDGGKGAVAVLAVSLLFSDLGFRNQLAAVAGGAAFLGHLFPVWLRFKGGKGVATFFGVLLMSAWPVGVAAGATWILVAALFRYSSLAALVAAVLAPTYALLLHQGVVDQTWVLINNPRVLSMLAVFMGVLILIRHRTNVARLRAGAEPKIGGKNA